MKRIKLYEEFLNEAKEPKDLYKAYLAIDPGSGHRWWSYKGFAADNFFIQVTLDNYKDIDINPDYPVLTYNSKVVQTLLDDKLIKLDNVYNRPEFIKQSGSKSEFHKMVDGDENIPKTCDNTKDAIKEIGFPMIAKPAEGHSGIGIVVMKDQKEWDAADHDKLDVYSQYIDKKSEHRLITFKGTPFFWMQREPMNDKAKSGKGKGDAAMEFKYIKKDVNDIPEKFNKLVDKFGKIFSDLPYICFDVMEDQDGKLYIIETNSQPGVPYNSTVEIYKQIFTDFYGRDVDSKTNVRLNELSSYLDQKTLETDPDRFEIDNN
jgi:hypothetical protein